MLINYSNTQLLLNINKKIIVLLQLDTLWGRKKAGSTRSVGQLSRPHSDSDFNELDEQVELIETLDEEALNERFEKMLVSC